MAATVAILAVTIISGAVTAYSQIQQGEAARAAAKYNSKVAQDAADYNARAAEQAGRVNADIIRRQAEHTMAEGEALTGASGVEMGEGSTLLVQMDNARESAIAQRREKYNAQVAAQGYLYQGAATAGIQNFQGRMTQRQSYVAAGSTLLTTGLKAYGTYSASQKPDPGSPIA